jgi:hypothetical protein
MDHFPKTTGAREAKSALGSTAAVAQQIAHRPARPFVVASAEVMPSAPLELPFRVPAKGMFSLREAAAVMGMSESFTEKLYDAGRELSGHEHNAGAGLRVTKRIPRVWLVAYMLRTARYENTTLVDALIAALHSCSREQQRRVHAALGLFLEST